MCGYAMADEVMISKEQLPKKAVEFVEKYYSMDRVSVAFFDKDLLDKDYKVRLANGTTIEFDKDGTWSEIECKSPDTVPIELLSAKIAEYLKGQYPSNSIMKLKRDKNSTEVELNNKLELVCHLT